MASEICEKCVMSLGVELQYNSKKILLVLDNRSTQSHVDPLKNKQLKFYIQIHTGTTSGHGNRNRIEDFILHKVGKPLS